MRALLIHNPVATATRAAVTDVVARALSGELKLEVAGTRARGDARRLAASAVDEGYDLVVALGGDGTVNEVLQSVAGTPTRLAIVPGGSTNVFARNLGLPNDGVEATAALLRRLAGRHGRRVNLGVANGHYFASNIGFGYDAAVVALVEQRYTALKRAVRQASFIYCGLLAWWHYNPRKVTITVDVGGVVSQGLRTVVCCNSDPYSYLGPRPVRLCPAARLDAGLDVTGVTRLTLPRLLRLAATALTSNGVGRMRGVRMWSDLPSVQVHSSRPLPLQADGDVIGRPTHVELRCAPGALTVV